MSPQETFLYWIKERWRVYLRKENGSTKPWSDDPIFQTTYFCNIRREDDKVTRWIRKYYSPYVEDRMFEYNIILSRFLNWPDTLADVGYQIDYRPKTIQEILESRASADMKVWGNAYVITTHGIKMPKVQYLCENVLGGVYSGLERLRAGCGRGSPAPTCAATAVVLQGFEGIGSFLAGQVIADLKHTKGHPLERSEDYWKFVVPGPGSIRGISWFIDGTDQVAHASHFYEDFKVVRAYFDLKWGKDKSFPYLDNQDLQNCLCEYDKYMRVKNGTGRSKRGYNGK